MGQECLHPMGKVSLCSVRLESVILLDFTVRLLKALGRLKCSLNESWMASISMNDGRHLPALTKLSFQSIDAARRDKPHSHRRGFQLVLSDGIS